MYEGLERRRTLRKNVYLIVQIIVAGKTVANGHILDINGNGVRVEIVFKMSEGEMTLKELLALEKIGLIIGNPGDERLITSTKVKWHPYSTSEDESICVAGLELIMSEPEHLKWQKYYDEF